MAKIWQNPNGTWSHHMDSKREWAEKIGCETDLRFARETQATDKGKPAYGSQQWAETYSDDLGESPDY